MVFLLIGTLDAKFQLIWKFYRKTLAWNDDTSFKWDIGREVVGASRIGKFSNFTFLKNGIFLNSMVEWSLG